MHRPTRPTGRSRAAALAAAVVAALLVWLPGTGSFAAWHAATPLEGSVSTGSLGIVPSTISGGSWTKDGGWFDPGTGRITPGSTLVLTVWNVPVTALGNNLTASFSPDVSGADAPATVADHLHLGVATDPATIRGATSESAAQRNVTLRLTLTADADLPLVKETVDLSRLTVTLGNGHGWTDTATLDAGTLTTSDGRPAGGTVQLSYDLAYDDGDDVIGFYLDDPAPGTTVEWDVYDGSQQIVTEAQQGLNEYDYTGTGNARPTIRIKGSFAGFGDPEQTAGTIGALTNVMNWTDAVGTTSAAYAFANATHLTNVNSVPSTVEDATSMFRDAGTGAGSLYVGWGDTSHVTSMAHMFDGATTFDQENISWDTSSVVDMSFMFAGATSFSGPIRFSTTANVVTMEGMFQGATSYTGGAWDGGASIQGWDTSEVTTMAHMFDGASLFDRDLRQWDTSKVTNMSSMFRGAASFNFNSAHSDAEFATDNGWDTSNVTTVANMFQGARAFDRDIGTWTTTKVTSFSNMFNGAVSFDRDIGGWDTSGAKNMSNMFRGAVAFDQDLGDWVTSGVTTMQSMFEGAAAFSQDLSRWDVAKVTNHSDFDKDSGLTADQLPVWAGADPAPSAPEPAQDAPAADPSRVEPAPTGETTDGATPGDASPDVTPAPEATEPGNADDGAQPGTDGAPSDATPDPDEPADPGAALDAPSAPPMATADGETAD